MEANYFCFQFSITQTPHQKSGKQTSAHEILFSELFQDFCMKECQGVKRQGGSPNPIKKKKTQLISQFSCFWWSGEKDYFSPS